MLTKFLETGKVQAEFPAIGKYYKNICYLKKKPEKQLLDYVVITLSKTKSTVK